MAVLTPYFLPIYITTGIMAFFLLAGLIFPRGPNAPVIRTCVSMSAVSIYLFWLVVYMSQMNPIMCPKMTNISYAWMKVKWGK